MGRYVFAERKDGGTMQAVVPPYTLMKEFQGWCAVIRDVQPRRFHLTVGRFRSLRLNQEGNGNSNLLAPEEELKLSLDGMSRVVSPLSLSSQDQATTYLSIRTT